jgi:hypothetical protein
MTRQGICPDFREFTTDRKLEIAEHASKDAMQIGLGDKQTRLCRCQRTVRRFGTRSERIGQMHQPVRDMGLHVGGPFRECFDHSGGAATSRCACT